MDLYSFLLFTLGVWAATRFWLIPKLEQTIKIVRNPAGFGTAISLAVVQAVQTTAVIAVLSSLLVIMAMVILSVYGGTTAAQLGEAIEVLRDWRNALSQLSWEWSAMCAAAAILMLGALARRNAKRRVTMLFRERYEQELNRLEKEHESGHWEKLPPTPEMQKVENEILQCLKILEELDGKSEGGDSARREEITALLHLLTQRRLALDIQRRMDLNLDPEQVLGPRPVTGKQKVQQFLISQGLLMSLRGVSRALFLSLAALLIPALLGVQVPAIAKALESRLVRLDDLRIEASQREAQEAWRQAQQSAQEASPPAELTAFDDEQALDALSRHFEEGFAAYARSVFARDSGISLRSQTVRKQILQHVAHQSGGRLAAGPSLAQAEGIDAVSREAVAT